MSAVTRLRVRAEMRRGARFVAFAVLLLGLGGGGALTAAAAARRTDTAFARLTAATRASDVLANPEDLAGSGLTTERIAALPGVKQVGAAFGVPLLHGGCTETDVAVLALESPVAMYEIDRPVIRAGRMPDPSRADEAWANSAAAEALGLQVGDTFELVGVPAADLEEFDDAACAAVAAGRMGTRYRFTLVGVGITVADTTPTSVLPVVVLTPAWWDASPKEAHFAGFAVGLRDGASGVPSFARAMQALAGDVAVDFQTATADESTIERGVRPQVIALWSFAGVLAVGTLLALGQAMLRRARMDEVDAGVLAALGMTARGRVALGVVRAVVVAVVGTIVAVGVALLCSGLFPRGLDG